MLQLLLIVALIAALCYFALRCFTVDEKKKERRAPCTCCDDTGKVTIKGIEYTCPRCKGDWREKEVVGETTVYSIAKWMLESVSAKSATGIVLNFKQLEQSAKRYSFTVKT